MLKVTPRQTGYGSPALPAMARVALPPGLSGHFDR
jgi:hypothetical protein